MNPRPFEILPAESWWRGASWPPRSWQSEALPAALGSIGAARAGLVQAVMGAGKSALIAELCRSVVPAEDARIIVSTPTVALVDQLSETIEERLGAPVGRYYTKGRRLDGPVIVACNPSLTECVRDLGAAGLRGALWIVDEAHNSECATLHEAAVLLDGVARLGLTATPYRSDERDALRLWDELLYSYGPRQALADGVVVPWQVRQWDGGQVDMDDACVAMIRQAVEEGLGSGVVDAGGWDKVLRRPMAGTIDAERFAARLVGEGIPAAAVHCRMSRSEVAARIEQLRTGALKVLVHVALLKEGVNLPWLRWLCLRRQVSSRVWFAQHVGRVLRACQGKEVAVILDPGDLFGVHSLSVEAALCGGLDDRSPVQMVLDLLREARKGASGLTAPARFFHGQAEVLGPLERELRRLTLALDGCGAIRRSHQVAAGSWRRQPATPKQLDAIGAHAGKLARASAPTDVLELLRWVWANREHLTRGAASDFLDLIFSLPGRRWPAEANTLLEVA